MRDEDVLGQIAALNPVTGPELARLDAAAGAALREGIVMTAQRPAPVRRRRLGRRSVLTGGLAVTLLGGGLAYAVVERGWYEHGGGHEGPTCLTESADPTRVDVDATGLATGGPHLTGDPVADCQEYQELSGRPPIEDPVAFRWGEPLANVYVAPRAQVPEGATLLAPRIDADPVHELSLSVDDLVGGLGARCLSADDAVVAAQAELDRLGLTDWQVDLAPRQQDHPAEKCAGFAIGFTVDPTGALVWPTGDEDSTGVSPRTLLVVPEFRADRDDLRGEGVDEVVHEVRDTLRAQISERCLDIDAARTIVDDTLGDLHHWPTSSVTDRDADCTRVYVVVGASIQVALYGPEAD